MYHTDTTPEAEGHAVFHSVINRTGATRYLLAQVLPALGTHHLVLWWDEATTVQATGAIKGALYLRGPKATAAFARSRSVIFLLQILYLWRHRDKLRAVTINSISNLGALIGCLLVHSGTTVTVFVHERPIGKWRLSIAVLRRIKSARIVTVSPFNKTELQAVGLAASWSYPAAFSTDLITTSEPVDRPGSCADTYPDIVIVSHPDGSKGFAFLCELLKNLDNTLSVHLYLSRSPSSEICLPRNVVVQVGQELTRGHYRARLTVITSDPIGIKETFSYITAESLAAGTPVLCFPSGGISEQLIHGVNGYFVSDYTVSAFKRAIESLFVGSRRILHELHKGAVSVNAFKSRCSV